MYILLCDEASGSTTYTYTLSLTYRICIGSFMSPDDISTSIEYISRIFREASPEEFSHRHLSYEAETLTVATFRVW